MYDVYLESNHPVGMQSQIDGLPKWNEEAKEQHLLALKEFTSQPGHYAKMERQLRSEIDSAKLCRLQSLVDYAFTEIPHYRQLYRSVGYESGALRSFADFEKLPIVQKADLRQIYEEVLRSPNTYVKFKARTSGSTGIPLSLINDESRTQHWFVTRLRMFEHMANARLNPSDWTYSIYYESFLLNSILGNYRTFTVGLNAEIDELVSHIRSLRPAIITGVASRVLNVARCLPDALELGIQAFTTNSEASSTFERKSLGDKIGVPILDEYSSEELGIIAWETRDGSYLVAEDTVHLELVNSRTPTNPIGVLQTIGTDLHNYAMPRIRYNQNDGAKWKLDSLASEFGLRRLATLAGREDMTLISPSKGPIEPGLIQQIFDVTLVPENSGIEEFRLVQTKSDSVDLLIKVSQSGASSAAISKFENSFLKLFGSDVCFQIKILSNLPPLGLKKRSIVRQTDA